MSHSEISDEQSQEWDELNKTYHDMLSDLQLASEKIQRLRLEVSEWYQKSLQEILS